VIRGANGAPVICGANGAPVIRGANGAPVICGANGAPGIRGANGAPCIRGANGAPVIRAANGARHFRFIPDAARAQETHPHSLPPLRRQSATKTVRRMRVPPAIAFLNLSAYRLSPGSKR
jgi:hypothetical protein